MQLLQNAYQGAHAPTTSAASTATPAATEKHVPSQGNS